MIDVISNEKSLKKKEKLTGSSTNSKAQAKYKQVLQHYYISVHTPVTISVFMFEAMYISYMFISFIQVKFFLSFVILILESSHLVFLQTS